MRSYLGVSYFASFSALAVASCCVLPVAFMLLGVGGSWLAIFGSIAATSYYALAFATAMVVLAWLMSHRSGTIRRLKWKLSASTASTALAWIIVFNETRINDYIILRM